MLHVRELAAAAAFPSPAQPSPLPAIEGPWFELKCARDDLKRYQLHLENARRGRVHYAILYWESRVCHALDRLWEAQENWKAARRGFA